MFLIGVGFMQLDFIYHHRIIHSIKTALACLIGFCVTKALKLHADQWVIITILVVMCTQMSVGSMLRKSYMRFLGSLSGSVLAIIAIVVFGGNVISIAATITFAAFLFSFIATAGKKYSGAGTLAAVTTAIILIGQNPTVSIASERFLEISLGILIAALVSQLVLPIHASLHLRLTQAKTVRMLHKYYVLTLITDPSEKNVLAYRELDEKIVKSLSSQRRLARQSKREPFGVKVDIDNFSDLLYSEKEIFRSIASMHYAYKMLPSGQKVLSTLPAVVAFHHKIFDVFEKIALRMEQPSFNETIVIPSLQPVEDAIQAAKKIVSHENLIYMDGFLFCTELLLIHLTEMATLLRQ